MASTGAAWSLPAGGLRIAATLLPSGAMAYSPTITEGQSDGAQFSTFLLHNDISMTRQRQVFLVACLTTAALCAQSLDWFQNKDHNFGNRWEGLFGQNQGSPAWELRSFLGYVEPYPMDSSVDLRVKYYVQDSTEAFIKAQSIKGTPNYLMIPKPDVLKRNPGWRDFGAWPTKDGSEQEFVREGHFTQLSLRHSPR